MRIGDYLQIASITNYLYAVETVARDMGHDVHVALYAAHTTDFTPESSRENALDLLAEKAVDIAVIEAPLAFAEPEGCNCRRIFDEPVVFFAHRESALAQKERPTLVDLRGKKFVGSLNYPEFQSRIGEICQAQGFVPSINVKMADTFNDFMRTDNLDEVFFLSAHGAARVPDPPYSPLVKLKIDDPNMFAPVYMVWRQDAGEAVGQFVAAVEEFARREREGAAS